MATQALKKLQLHAVGFNPAALDELQWEQFQHDEKFHREIARLTVQDRLKHMALHFAKYAGNLVEAGSDETSIKRIVSDVLIIAVSTANVLNLRLSDHVANLPDGDGQREFGPNLTVLAGRMAAACEKMDHLEDFPFRRSIAEATLGIFAQALLFSHQQGWDIGELIELRLGPVKKKQIFFGRL